MDHYKNTFQIWNQLASKYEDKFMDLDSYNDTYDFFCEQIKKPNASIFEIGCGPGNITKYLLSNRPDFKITATDVAPNMVESAQRNNPTAICKVMDCREMDTITEKFDGVVCGFCMPYLSKEDCQKLIANSARVLNDLGVIYFSAIEGDYNKSDYETSSDGQHTMFVYLHQEGYLSEFLHQNDFKIIATDRKTYPKNDQVGTHLILIAKKKT